jgi:hypothetical protein
MGAGERIAAKVSIAQARHAQIFGFSWPRLKGFELMNEKIAQELKEARIDFLIARMRYLLAARRAEQMLYRTDRPALLRKQAS